MASSARGSSIIPTQSIDGSGKFSKAAGTGGGLSPAESASGNGEFTGAITGNVVWTTFDTTRREYWIINNTTGAFTFTLKTPLGTGVVIPQNGASGTKVYCDGTNIVASPTGGPASMNYFGDGSDGAVTISSNTTLATSTGADDTGVIIKNYSSLIINSSISLTAANRCKAMLIYVSGNCTINGTLHMNARGAVGMASDIAITRQLAAAGLFSHEYPSRNFIIPTPGAAGGASVTDTNPVPGIAGANGANGQTGGGGSGGTCDMATSGAGAAGTAFCGGSGGGASGYVSGSVGTNGVAGATNGGAGGAAGAVGLSGSASGGGAGNPAGAGSNAGSGTSFSNSPGGGGGTLILIIGGNLTVGASGVISADGSRGGNAVATDYRASGGGGAGGGAVIVVYAGTLSNSGTVRAAGGAGGTATGGAYSNVAGGAGGNGSVQGPTQITP